MLVGYDYSGTYGGSYGEQYVIPEYVDGYGLQNENAKGYWYNGNEYVYTPGTMSFSDRAYWSSLGYVYNENSLIYPYIQNYKNILSQHYSGYLDVKLLDISKYSLYEDDVYYWTGNCTDVHNNSLNYYDDIKANGNNGISDMYNSGSYQYGHTDIYGVRPVIEIDKKYLD